MRDKRKVVYQFKKQLNELYASGTHILVLFEMYLGFLAAFADRPNTVDKYRLSLWTSWQIADMKMSIHNDKIDTTLIILETAWLYGRREGKTRGLTIVGVFFSLLEYQVAWRAPHGEQLKKASFWFSCNPFVEKVMLTTDNTIRIYDSLSISIAPMTTGRVAGGDCDILIYDEGGWIYKRLQAYELYLASRPMVSNSHFKHIINASTPFRDTAFQDAWDTIQELELEYDTTLTSLHDCEDCPWITPEFIEQESKRFPKWYIEVNYYCLWSVPFGAVFEKIILVGSAKQRSKYPQFDSEFLYKVEPHYCGVDHNAGDNSNPHYLVTGHYDDNFVYVLDEYTFTDLHFLFDERWENLSMEIEDGLHNDQFTTQERSMGKAAIYQPFSKELKMKRVQDIRNRTTIIDKERAPLTYTNYLNAAYKKDSRLVELEKKTDQHGIDCVLHFMHDRSGVIYSPKHVKKVRELFGGDGRENPLLKV